MDIEMNRAELLTRFLLQRPAPAHRLMLAGLKPAAVLIPLVERSPGAAPVADPSQHHPAPPSGADAASPADARIRKMRA